MEEERRAVIRHRTLKGGRIVVNDGFSTYQCTVRNLSPAGAQLRVTSIIGIPDSFDLLLDDKQSFACTVIWRRETELGVSFS
ncbi:MAG: PilZ protein [Devosia sp.]|uniref:PilZ domain-containing protein n=1 Tax=Devosia sp. TaxID=1871048 RepID=UPI00262B15F2|nr:PilZ domain-containing protein [Devosia sp.]MDB5537243.1 PilZ protein [Devosia sp.]MDB5588059.1 PilZ protein [Devosia sp.]